MGESYNEFKKVAIIRHLYSKMVSSYFFYKNGQPVTPGAHKKFLTYLRVAFARVMPFFLWSLLYPYTSNVDHLTDEKGELLVDYIGRLENLSDDIFNIFQEIGLDLTKKEFPNACIGCIRSRTHRID